MAREQSEPTQSHRNGTVSETLFSRRSYLKAAGIGAALLGSAGVSSATRAGDADVNIVDAGADNSGETAINSVLNDVHANGTSIYFPPGEYRLEPFSSSANNWSWYGADATVVVPNSVTGNYLHFRGTGWTVDGIDIDLSAPDAAPVNHLNGGDWTFRNVEFVGQMGDPANRGSSSLLYMDADSGTEGVVENVIAMDGSADVGDSSNRGGLRIVGSAGDITLRNVAVSGFANNSMYFHNMPGHLLLDGCYLEDTNTGLRIGGNTTVRNTVFDQSRAPTARWSGGTSARGVWINSNGSTPGDITIEGCSFRMGGSHGAHAIYSSNALEGIEIRDCVIEQHTNYFAIQLDSGGSGETVIENVSITGDASRAGIYLSGRSGARLRNLCLQKSGDGVRIRNSSNVRIENSTINVGGTDVSGSAQTSGIRTSGSCPAPNVDWELEEDSSDDERDGSDDSDDDSSEEAEDDDEQTPDGTAIRLEGSAEYVIEASGDIQPSPEIAQWVEEGEHYGEGRVEWYLTDSWTEWYFTGDLETFELENTADLTVYVDGEEVDPEDLPPSDDDDDDDDTDEAETKLRLEGEAEYLIEVSGDIRPADSIAQWVEEGEQYGDGQVEWYLTGSWTEWHFTGDIETFELENTVDLTVYVDGEEVDPTELADGDGESSDETQLRLEGTAEYRIEVSGDIRPADSISQWVEDGRQYGDGQVDWYLNESWTEWYYTGEITYFELDDASNVDVFLDGSAVDPDTL